MLHDVVSDKLVGTSVIRAALIGALGGRKRASRPVLALEQVRTVARLRSLRAGATPQELPALAGAATAALALSYLLREAARRAGGTLPGPLANAAVAAGTTWALAEAVRRLKLAPV